MKPSDETQRLRARVAALESELAQSRAAQSRAAQQECRKFPGPLQTNTEFLQAMAETLPAAICIFDPQTITYSYVSRGYERMLGHQPETLLDGGPLYVLQLIHPDDLERVNTENAAAIAEYEQRPADAPPFLPPKFEYRFRHADGSWRWLLTYGMVFGHKADGRIARILNISLDITAHKELEARLRSMQQELECRVAERTASLEQANHELRAEIAHRKLEEERKEQQEEFLRGLLKTNENDRQLMAHDLHDGVLQDLTASVWQLDSLRAASGQFSEAERKRFDLARAILRRAIDEGRRLLSGLRPPILDEQGIVAALQYLAAELRQKHALELELSFDVRFKRLDPLVEVTIFRIVQQALTNVAQHSRSARAEVMLAQQSESMQLSVRDWGVGFDSSHVDRQKFGLRGIVRRAELVGGTARIVSRPNEGTQILVELPLPSPAAL